MAALFVCATAIRLRFNLSWHKPGDFIFSDMWVYEHRAGHLFDRDAYAWDTFTPCGYPALLALVFRFVGRDFAVVGALQALIGGAIPVLTHALARKVSPSRFVAQCAGVMMALYAPLIFYGGLLLTEVPFSLLLLLVILFVLRTAADDERRWWLWAGASGVVLSLAVLTRPNVLVVVPGIALYFWTALRRDRKRAGRRTAVLLAAALPLLVWCVVHNSRIAGHSTGLSTNGGLNFFLAQSEYRGAHFLEGDRHHEIVPIPNALRYTAMYESPVPLYDERHFYREGIRQIAKSPFQLFASLDNVKFGLGLGSLEYWPNWAPIARVLAAFSRSVFWLVLLPAGIYFAGFMLLRRHRKPEEAPRLLLFLTAFSVVPVFYLFLGDPRLRVPFDPLFVVLALDGLSRGRAALKWARQQEETVPAHRSHDSSLPLGPG